VFQAVRILNICLIAGCVLSAGCGAVNSTSPLPPPAASLEDARATAIAEIRQTLNALETEGLYGVAYLTDKDSVLLHQAFGYRNRETGEPMTVTTGFDIGSITKAMTAATVLKLEEQGKLQRSDPVSKFFPDVPAPLSNATVAQLMDHTAGLPEYLGDDYQLLDKPEAIEQILDAALLFEPGTDEAYSNTGYTLLALIIEDAAGQPFEQTLRETVLLTVVPQIGYRLADWQNSELAVGYVDNEAKGTPLDWPWLEDGPSWELRGNGGLLSTAENVAQWFAAMFEGRILGPAALGQFEERFAGSGPYGIHVGEAGSDDLTGFNAHHEAWPDVGVSWTLITSRSSYPAEEVWEEVEDAVSRLVEIESQSYAD